MAKPTIETLFAATRRVTTKHHLVAVIEHHPDGSGAFKIDIAQMLLTGEAEALAKEILTHLCEAPTIHDCPSCRDTAGRATLALAALSTSTASPLH